MCIWRATLRSIVALSFFVVLEMRCVRWWGSLVAEATSPSSRIVFHRRRERPGFWGGGGCYQSTLTVTQTLWHDLAGFEGRDSASMKRLCFQGRQTLLVRAGSC